ncbi:hypothetical protein AtubIFM55763_005562 [Aspergillus tubingensis]|nr:hypothetical protein AtubIFM55763_005562 [Aspergillus tubingensis]
MGVDNYSKQEMIGLGITFLFLPCIFVGFRIWAKWLSRRSLQADDYLIFGGLVSSPNRKQLLVGRTDLLKGSIDGLLGQHETTGPDGQPLLHDPKFLTYQKVSSLPVPELENQKQLFNAVILINFGTVQVCQSDDGCRGPRVNQNIPTCINAGDLRGLANIQARLEYPRWSYCHLDHLIFYQ